MSMQETRGGLQPLKVVLIERSFLEKEAEVEDMLSMLEQEKEVPGTLM